LQHEREGDVETVAEGEHGADKHSNPMLAMITTEVPPLVSHILLLPGMCMLHGRGMCMLNDRNHSRKTSSRLQKGDPDPGRGWELRKKGKKQKLFLVNK